MAATEAGGPVIRVRGALALGQVLKVCLLALLLVACGAEPSEPEPPPDTEPGATATSITLDDLANVELNPVGGISVASPTPRPTAQPGPVGEAVETLVSTTGLDQYQVFGFGASDLINLAISILYIALAVFVVVPLTLYLLRRLLVRSRVPFGEDALSAVATQIRWLIGLLIVQYSINRLGFLPVELKRWTDQLFFTLYTILLAVAAWRVAELGFDLFQSRIKDQPEQAQAQILLPVGRRSVQVLILIVAVTVILNGFGVSVTVPVILIGLIGFFFSIAARDTMTDIFEGFVILLDPPFRVGDRIEIEELGRWGDVVEIGPRTTRIRTRDNLYVTIPNTRIGRNQVVNYTYPDPEYRIETRVMIAWGPALDEVRQLLADTVRNVEGVLAERPVDVLVDDLGDPAVTFRIRWWSSSYSDKARLRDRVNTALYHGLMEEGVELPYATQLINLSVAPPPMSGQQNAPETD